MRDTLSTGDGPYLGNPRSEDTKSESRLLGPHFMKSLYVNPKESKGFTSGARQMNPGFTQSRGVAMNTESGIAHVGAGPCRDGEGLP